MDHHEAYFNDVGKTLAPRGYNVHNTNEAKRERNRSTARRKRKSHCIIQIHRISNILYIRWIYGFGPKIQYIYL